MSGEIRIPPFGRIIPPGAPVGESPEERKRGKIWLSPGAGWGNGAHETTQLCLQAIALLDPRPAAGFRALDFGSGTGILSIGAAMLGGQVDAVEIDDLATETARENARRNGVADAIRFSREIEVPDASCALVVANVLRPVLLEFSPKIAGALSAEGVLVLSGLVATDIPELTVRYSALLPGRKSETYRRGEWRVLVFKPQR